MTGCGWGLLCSVVPPFNPNSNNDVTCELVATSREPALLAGTLWGLRRWDPVLGWVGCRLHVYTSVVCVCNFVGVSNGFDSSVRGTPLPIFVSSRLPISVAASILLHTKATDSGEKEHQQESLLKYVPTELY